RWREVSEVKLKEDLATWKEADGRERELAYAKLPPLWLAPPAAGPSPGRWPVRTVLGGGIVLGRPDPFRGSPAKEFTAVWQGQPLRLAAADVAILYQVPKNP